MAILAVIPKNPILDERRLFSLDSGVAEYTSPLLQIMGQKRRKGCRRTGIDR